MTELGIVIETEFSVHAKDTAFSSLAKRVDLNLRRVLLLVDPVEVNEDVSSLRLSTLALEAELLRDVKSFLLAEALLEVDGGGDDGRWIFRGDLLDVHTTLCRRDKNGSSDTTIVENSNVVFVLGVAALGKHNSVADAAVSTGLLGDQLSTEHLASKLLRLLGALDKVDTALQPVVELALAPAASENLGLDDTSRGIQFFRCVIRLLRSLRGYALWGRDSVRVQKLDGLVFMDGQEAFLTSREGARGRASFP